MSRDPIAVHCQHCKFPGTVTRALWQRLRGQLACGKCRKTTTWRAA